MTNFQLQTQKQVKELKEKINAVFDPSRFTLNKEYMDLCSRLNEVQQECDHIWEGKFCSICGKEDDTL